MRREAIVTKKRPVRRREVRRRRANEKQIMERRRARARAQSRGDAEKKGREISWDLVLVAIVSGGAGVLLGFLMCWAAMLGE